MAKIKYHTEPIVLPETQRIDGKEWETDYKERLKQAHEFSVQQHKTNMKAKEVYVGEKEENKQ